ncbi:FAD/NAD(P)-binding protein [Panacibacter sp. DH6]|uniref:FAD/NAD(P)-binding protein n=1 Tax=Panacibacter microcysteis TaxID=2793269 RepID=A0A931MDD4_9BACT|nr:FAD/NAD(P)-binding protein [Panacibacter microcysteis]MBG9378308.1 FAD/NAD(P)-binding protein [Panacibacter microcysteis]
MELRNNYRRFAIIGGGPSGMFMFKRLIESGLENLDITIYEASESLGKGMPYSHTGANHEHITNVSDNEIPALVTSVEDWLHSAPTEVLKAFDITPAKFNEYKVLPRLFFGEYLSAQFELLIKLATKKKIKVQVHLNTPVEDVSDNMISEKVTVTAGESTTVFDAVIICTGHNWPLKNEGKIPGYFDSPYPPSKLARQVNFPVAIKGASLTAIDAVRTLARSNGSFYKNKDGMLCYKVHENSEGFKIVLHSKDGLLPAVRFHLEDSHLSNESMLTSDALKKHMQQNDGFVSLDYLFEWNFKEPIRKHDPAFYDEIKDMTLEAFVESMMDMRENIDAFNLLKAEYTEAEQSIKRRQSVYWKEMLAVLSFAMNYPAKHLSAEDMLRLKKVLMPLISIVIAFVPQSSCREIIALHDAGVLSLIAVDEKSDAKPHDEEGAVYHYDHNGEKSETHYRMFVDCVGQPHLSIKDFPFESLVKNGTLSPARIRFRSEEEGRNAMQNGNKQVEADAGGAYFLQVPGITIDDQFRAVDMYGAVNDRVYIMAVPYIGGYNPDYSGLDFGEAASEKIMTGIENAHRKANVDGQLSPDHLSTASGLK